MWANNMKMRNHKFTIETLEAWLSSKVGVMERGHFLLLLLLIIYCLIFSGLAVGRYYAFKTCAWDLGIFTQSLWTTLFANRFFYYTCELFINPSGCFFGVHFSPVLFFVLPFYRLYTAPETLLIFQSLIIALAALPIYKLAKEQLNSRLAGLTFALAYLIYPAIQWVNWYDFHVQAFLPIFFTFTIYYATKRNWVQYFVFLVLSLMCIEHVAFITFFIGLYIAWRYKRIMISRIKRKEIFTSEILVPLLTIAVSVIWYWFTLWQRDTFFPTNPIAIEEFLGAANFTILGAKSPLEIPVLILFRPLNAIQALIYNGHMKLLFLFLIFGPLAFYSFRKPSALIPTIPWFLFSFVSQALVHYSLGNHYPAFITAFVFISAIFGVKSVYPSNKIKNLKKALKKILICSIVIFLIASPLSPLVYVLFPEKVIFIGEHERILSNIISKLPQNVSILTQDNIFPHVSHNINAYVVPIRHLTTSIQNLVIDFVNQTIDHVEYILLDNKTDPVSTSLVVSLLEKKSDFLLMDSWDNNTILLYRKTKN